jgi:hypothetical protein
VISHNPSTTAKGNAVRAMTRHRGSCTRVPFAVAKAPASAMVSDTPVILQWATMGKGTFDICEA